jgi:hypothetical protein
LMGRLGIGLIGHGAGLQARMRVTQRSERGPVPLLAGRMQRIRLAGEKKFYALVHSGQRRCPREAR